MLYLAIGQHRKHLTANIRNESGDVICRRQVRREWTKVRAFFADLVRQAEREGGFMAIVEGGGLNDWSLEMLSNYGCQEIVLIQPEGRSRCFPIFRRAAERRGMEVAPGTLGILSDPKHPALARFPTEFHSNWQWWHLVKHSRPVILDDTPHAYRPIVQVIDNFERNHELGLVFEARVGRGKLLVCAVDLLTHQDKPEARQLLHSLLKYMDSPAFDPRAELDRRLLKELFPGRPVSNFPLL